MQMQSLNCILNVDELVYRLRKATMVRLAMTSYRLLNTAAIMENEKIHMIAQATQSLGVSLLGG